jgi:hypothetical protein
MRTTFQSFATMALLCCAFSVHPASPKELTERSFAATGRENGTVLLHVNWGRKWKCGVYENAQLQELAFSRLLESTNSAPESSQLRLSVASSLLAKNTFQPYAYIVEPGEYALSGFNLKLARSVSDIGHITGDASSLIKEGRAIGGTFTVAPGEIVYIGHFTVDCGGEPTLWRYYIEGRDEFDRYANAFHKKFPSTRDVPVIYRLFTTDVFGKPYALGE